MKFNIGDRVVVISIGAGNGWAPSMDQYLHKTGTIIADYRADPAREFDSLGLSWDERPIRYQVEFTLAESSDLLWIPEDSLELRNQKRHKHADLIHAWADGAEIEIKLEGEWVTDVEPDWYLEYEYRIKPKELYWWETIPEHGILARSVISKYVGVLTGKPDIVEQWIPLTNEEIERFKR